ncbi:MAG: uracil-DNA glycosylase [Ignavibacteria bacterium]|nr:uracil-DNA glycosylase [Ignavibacteria bacterium]
METKNKIIEFLNYLKEIYGEYIYTEESFQGQNNPYIIKESSQAFSTSQISHSLDIFSIGTDWFSAKTLTELEQKINKCTKCNLGTTRTNFVFGDGNPKAEIVFVGEAPGEEEDIQGLPFVGKAGRLLTKLMKSVGFEREEVYICNILKCRPPKNRKPLPTEVELCKPYLLKQLELIKPKIIVALGATAVESLLNTKVKMAELRGKILNFYDIPLFVTYHPAALLRTPGLTQEFLDDLKSLKEIFEKGFKK